MKFFNSALALLLIFASTVYAQSRILIEEQEIEEYSVEIDEQETEKCSVEIDENYFFGVLAAKKEIDNISFFSFDSFTFIESKDGKNSCDFIFDLYSKKEVIGSAQIVLSKPDWQRISRKITKGYDTARW